MEISKEFCYDIWESLLSNQADLKNMSRRLKNYEGINLSSVEEHFVFRVDMEYQLEMYFNKEDYQELEDKIQDEDVKFLMRKYRGRKKKGGDLENK